MIEPAQITTASVHESIMERHNEQMYDNNPDFMNHSIRNQGREVHVDFKYFGRLESNGEFTYKYRSYDGRKWS